jgi:hypothetical protein
MALTDAKERNAQIKTISKNYETSRLATWKTFNTARENILKAYRSSRAACVKNTKTSDLGTDLSATINSVETNIKAAE